MLAVTVNAWAANTDMQITEWMYKGSITVSGKTGFGEFAEFTNTGTTSIDMTGWSYADDSKKAGDVSLSAFGVVAAGESVILTDAPADTFRSDWGLSASVKIIGGNSKDNLGNGDMINLYDTAGTLIDSLTYGSTGNPITNGKSCNIPAADYGLTTASSSWVLASVGDSYGSWTSSLGEVGSPGKISNVPEPATMVLLGLGSLILANRRKS